MASETQIRMNFQNALRRAQEIEDIGNKLLSLAQDETNQCLLELEKGWSGYAHDAMCVKTDRLQDEAISIANKLKRTADTIRKIAKVIYDTEMKNLQIAMEREKRS